MHVSFLGGLGASPLFLSQSTSMLMLVLAYFLRIYKRINALLIWKKPKQMVILKYLQVYVHNKKYL